MSAPPAQSYSSAPSLAGPWLALLILAVPVATIGALCSLIAPWWVITLEAEPAGLHAQLQQRWLLVVPVRSRDLGILESVELRFEELKKPGPVRIGGGVKESSYRLQLRHGGGRWTELAAGHAEAAETKLRALLADPSLIRGASAKVWVGKPLLGLWLPLFLLLTAAGLVVAFALRLLRRS